MTKCPFPTRNLYTVNRWFSFIAGLIVSSCAGTQYMFGSLGPKIKSTMNYEQYQINFVGTMGNLGASAGFVPSIFHDIFGARPTQLLCGLFLFSGWFLVYLSITKTIQSTYLSIAFYFFLLGQGCSGAFTTSVSTNIKNFTISHRGKVVGSHAACLGLSGAMFTAIYKIVFRQKFHPYLLFLAIFCGSVPFVIGTAFENVVPKKKKSLEEVTVDDLVVNAETPSETTSLVSSSLSEFPQTPTTETEFIEEDVHPLRVAISLDFWLFFAVYFAGSGAGLTIINNLGNLVISYGGKDGDQDIMTELYSIGNCTGRLFLGFISDRYSAYAQRTTFFNACILLIGFCSFLISFAPLKLLTPLIGLTGFIYGGILSTCPAFVSERFGPKYYAVNIVMVSCAPALSSYILSTVIASHIYQSHIHGSNKECIGRKCYGVTLLIIGGLCAASFIVGLFLMHKTKRMYAVREKHKK